ncbi:hypothetical protein Ancab_038560 [Ancistrocladus abbreviatus]
MKLKRSLMLLLYGLVLVFSATLFPGCSSAAQELMQRNNKKKPTGGSTALFPVGGSVYPDGYFFVTVNIGQPPKPYDLDIDTGSDVTWVQCDAPCVTCLESPHDPYKPRNNIARCEDPLCASMPQPRDYPCDNPTDQCNYEVKYTDNGSSLGVLVKDDFHIQMTNGSVLNPSLNFGCGYDQVIQSSSHPPFVDGVLGLGNGKPSILSQLRDMGVIRNVIGHCFSHKGGGYLFFGDDLLLTSGITWAPLHNPLGQYYSLGAAKLMFAGQGVVKGGLRVVFDSGTTYTYFNSQAYEATISMIKKNIDPKKLKDAPEDETLPVCWRSAVPFKSIDAAKKFFKPFTLSFENSKNMLMEIPPEAYLIISVRTLKLFVRISGINNSTWHLTGSPFSFQELGNVCLGILDGSEVGWGDLNVLGGKNKNKNKKKEEEERE